MQAVIIDDEDQARSALKQEIQLNCPEIELIGEANSVQSGIELLQSVHPQLVFLDVRLTDGIGFDILEACAAEHFQVIFTTAFDHYALQAIKFSALDYLLKPVGADELFLAVEKAKEKQNKQDFEVKLHNLLENIHRPPAEKKIAIHTATGIHLFRTDKIVRCMSNGNYTQLFFVDGKKLTTAKPLKEFEELLKAFRFERIHHSHIINLDQVESYMNEDNGYVVMQDKSTVPVSQRKKAGLLKVLNSI